MEAIDLLKQQARDKRNKAILAAKREYRIAIQEIRSLQRRLRIDRAAMPRQAAYDRLIIRDADDSCVGMTVIGAVEFILREVRPMTITELTLEVQRRGVRSRDDSRSVARAIRTGIGSNRHKFTRNHAGKWSLVAD